VCGSWLLNNKALILPHIIELDYCGLAGFLAGIKRQKKARQNLPRQTITTKGEWRNMF